MVVWRFDRAFRSLKHALEMLEVFEAHRIEFCELTHKIDTSTAMGRAFFQVRGLFAELERGMISERTVAGMEAARRRGIHVGRPYALTPDQLVNIHKQVRSGRVSLNAAAWKLGVHADTLRRGFRRQGLDWKPRRKGPSHER